MKGTGLNFKPDSNYVFGKLNSIVVLVAVVLILILVNIFSKLTYHFLCLIR